MHNIMMTASNHEVAPPGSGEELEISITEIKSEPTNLEAKMKERIELTRNILSKAGQYMEKIGV